MSPADVELLSRVETWIAQDPDQACEDELRALVVAGDLPALADRFQGPLKFGTAGLRGLLGAGPHRMNRAVVIRATAGLCAYLKEHILKAAERGVCVAFDGRRGSRQFAQDAAEVIVGAGLEVFRFGDVVPTPVLAFAVLDCGAAAGIMITASHNPPEYNGYKVYWENGAQIIPPHDEGIAQRIDEVGSAAGVPRLPVHGPEGRGRSVLLGEDLARRYLDAVRAVAVHPRVPRDVTIAYTALHGVGQPLVRRALQEAGFERVHCVAAQGQPDGDFPTVRFPNPEEPGAMDLVLALAEEVRADLIVANDPDADRLAVAVRTGDGGVVQLTGNEVGCLLAHYLLDHGEGDDRLVASSIVSSPMLGAIAEAHDVQYVQTLTGFKWIANESMRLERERGLRYVVGYEEALGYAAGTSVRDKDGVSAIVLIADMAAWCRSMQRTLLDERETMWRRYGLFMSSQVAVVLRGAEGAERMTAVMNSLRREPLTELSGHRVLSSADLQSGVRTAADGSESPLEFPKSNVLLFDLEGGHRVMLRPSGTEPKIKFYFDVRVPVADDEPMDEARARGIDLLDALAAALRQGTGI